tara:strand:+ start:228 stop:575 length:348 start_codon:yes stop_codon:yes gene_type:complete
MDNVIDITELIKKKDNANVDALSEKLANVISELNLSEEYEAYMAEGSDYVYGMPFIFTMFPLSKTNEVKTLSDVTDVLTTLTITLDNMGYDKWANQISSIVGEMFASGSFGDRIQ